VGCRKVLEIKDLVDVAVVAARQAAGYLRGARLPAPGEWTEKSRHDFATEVDRGAEALIAETLTRLVPGSTIVGEELSPGATHAGDVVWLVDPLDGTTNYLHGYPQYAVSIGCVVRGALCVGVVHDVVRDLAYRAGTGYGAWLGERRLAVSPITEPRHSLVGTGFPFKRLEVLEDYLRQFTAVMRASSGVRRAGAATLDLADVAAGRLDAFWELTLAPWDVAAGIVLIREAGGVVTNVAGEDDVLSGGSIVAGNPTLHRWLMDLLRTISASEGPTLDGWLEDLAAGTPAPGGGSAAALAGTLAGALVTMVARLTTSRKSHAAVQGRVEAIFAEAKGLRAELRRLVDEDAAAYARVAAASREAKDDALMGAVQTPLAIARAAVRLIALAREIATIGNPNARSDATVGEMLARAALAAAAENVRVNVAALSRPEKGKDLLDEAEGLAAEGRG
jgi:myo-inositol-1(or 4)-monophosphatase